MAFYSNLRIEDNSQSYRDLVIVNNAAKADSQKIIVTEETIRKELASIEAQITAKEKVINTLMLNPTTLAAPLAAATAERNALLVKKNNATSQLVRFRIAEASAAKETAMVNRSVASTPGVNSAVTSSMIGAQTATLGFLNPKGSLELQYNASTVRESYLSSSPAFTSRFRIAGNSPRAVKEATDLWQAQTGAHKGMIVTSAATVQAWNSGSQKPTSANQGDNHNYGFQFMYNPGSVSMSYYTSPNIDVTLMTSGQDLFNLSGVSNSQGSVTFQVIINRIFDMQYFNRFGIPRDNAALAYSKPPQTSQEWRELYEKGTMYDVEFLLRTLMGTTMSSYLRGINTADMGWLPAIPVELHLGKSLRYLGTVNDIQLNHTIFDERMVPLFTTCQISFARLPDYPATEGMLIQ
jgi:hypothetical protein